MTEEYIKLEDNEVIRAGDQVMMAGDVRWQVIVSRFVGETPATYPLFQFRRSRLVLVRDAAIKLLKKIYTLAGDDEVADNVWPEAVDLRVAIGIRIEDLVKSRHAP